jgi:protein ImuB
VREDVRGETPLAVADKVQGAMRLTACDAEAQRLGLRPGLTLSDARARVPLLQVEQADYAADQTFLGKLAELCDLFTPLFAIDGRDGLLLDITGCAHLFGDEEGLYAAAVKRFGACGVRVRASISVTPDAARAFARFLDHAPNYAIALPGEEAALARTLPVEALGLAQEAVTALKRAGLKTVADLTDRPSAVLAARFGMAAMTQLNRVMGLEDIRLTPLRAPPDCMAEQQFAAPLLDMDNLLRVLERLAGIVTGQLEGLGLGGRVFEASFFRSDGAIRRMAVETAQPLRDAAVILRLMRLRMEGLSDPLDPGFGFDAIRLAVLASAPLGQAQRSLDGAVNDGAQVAGLADQFSVRFGRERVMRFAAHDTHDPVRAGDAVPVISGTQPLLLFEPDPDALPLRPLTMFDRPQPIEVLAEVPDGPPLRFRWRRVSHEVVLAEGPERIAPEWWRQDSAMQTRDYYRVEDAAGHRFWVYREGFYGQAAQGPRWYVHGLFA